MIQLQVQNKLLFIGDSITDAGRKEYFGANLGQGYVNIIAGHLFRHYTLLQLDILNRGIGGDIITDLRYRWQEDCLNHQPDILTIQIGINDLWHRFSAGLEFNQTALLQFRDNYTYLIESARKQNSNLKIILMEPFVLPYPTDRLNWRDDLLKLNQTIEDLSNEYQATLVKLDSPLNVFGDSVGYEFVTGEDGVHPTNLGHAIIADLWLRTTDL